MKLKKNINTLVIVGDWNSLLITPNWLNNVIYDGKLSDNLKPGVYIKGNSVLYREYQLPNLNLHVSPERIALRLPEESNEYELLIECVTKILSKLPHTPISALGINFTYEERGGNQLEIEKQLFKLDNLFETKRVLVMQHDEYKLTIGIKSTNETIGIDFNYNYEAMTVSRAKEILSIDIINKLQEDSSRLVESLRESLNEYQK